MKISRVDAFAIRMEKSTHGNVRGGTQPEVDDLGDHVIAKMAWTAIYSQQFLPGCKRVVLFLQQI